MAMESERSFLHAIANPLATCQFVLDSVLEDLTANSAGNADNNKDAIEQLQEVQKAMEKAIGLLRARREELVKAGVAS